MRSSRKLKVNLKRRPVHLNAQITQKAVPAYPLSFEREENHSQKSEHHSIIRHYAEGMFNLLYTTRHLLY